VDHHQSADRQETQAAGPLPAAGPCTAHRATFLGPHCATYLGPHLGPHCGVFLGPHHGTFIGPNCGIFHGPHCGVFLGPHRANFIGPNCGIFHGPHRAIFLGPHCNPFLDHLYSEGAVAREFAHRIKRKTLRPTSDEVAVLVEADQGEAHCATVQAAVDEASVNLSHDPVPHEQSLQKTQSRSLLTSGAHTHCPAIQTAVALLDGRSVGQSAPRDHEAEEINESVRRDVAVVVVVVVVKRLCHIALYILCLATGSGVRSRFRSGMMDGFMSSWKDIYELQDDKITV
jgi:hypothetical protein